MMHDFVLQYQVREQGTIWCSKRGFFGSRSNIPSYVTFDDKAKTVLIEQPDAPPVTVDLKTGWVDESNGQWRQFDGDKHNLRIERDKDSFTLTRMDPYHR